MTEASCCESSGAPVQPINVPSSGVAFDFKAGLQSVVSLLPKQFGCERDDFVAVARATQPVLRLARIELTCVRLI